MYIKKKRFPRVLELCANYPDLRDEFESLTAQIPSWMFLRWTAQLLAALGYHHAKSVVPILEVFPPSPKKMQRERERASERDMVLIEGGGKTLINSRIFV